MRVGRRAGRRGSRLALVAAAFTALVAAGALGAGDVPHAAAAPLVVAGYDPTPRPLGPITVFGDSVLKGSMETAPSFVDRLAEQGWGPIRARAGGAYSTGEWLTSGETRASYWIQLWRSQGWDPVDVVINLGANDVGQCRASVACARRMILFVVDQLGPGHRIWWPMITHLGSGYAEAWNAALAGVAAERDDFFTWDWPTEMRTGGYSTGDGIHLSPDSYRRRSQVMAAQVTATLGSASLTGGPAALPEPAAAPSDFVPLTSARVLDTRLPAGAPIGPVAAEQHVEVDVSGVVPDGATAVAVYVAATETGGPGFLTAYPCDRERPTASNVNHPAGATRGAVTIVPVADGMICLFTKAGAHLLADVQGAFVPAGTDDRAQRLVPLDEPQRLADTRSGDPVETLTVAVPDGARSAVVNLTAVAGAEPGYATAYPCDAERPHAAAVNFGPDETIAAAAYVPVAGDGSICVFVKGGAHVIVDLTATFVGAGDDGGLMFVPVGPTRTLDTRVGIGGWAPVSGPGQTLDAVVAPPGSQAVSGTITLAAPVSPGYLRVWGCNAPPDTSSVNAATGATLANHVTTSVSDDGKLCVFSLSRGTTIFDTTGWWVAPE